jgi:putative membrane protein
MRFMKIRNGKNAPMTERLDFLFYSVLAMGAALVWRLSVTDPAALPFWAPWEFAPLQFVCFWLAGWWYARGVLAAGSADRPPAWRIIFFYAGLLSTYAVLMTRFEYLAEHMFFINRFQHIVMHHLGPMLIVLGWPGAEIKRAMPAALRRLIESRWVVLPVHWIQQPVLAAVLFVGLIGLWLYPPVHFRAMIDPNLYALMNWSMVVDGILFWSLILDPRPKPQARISFVSRIGLVMAVMFPQIMMGAMITFTGHDIYDFYHWCGRIFPDIGALRDQMYGGLIVWIPGAMMSVISVLLVLNFLRQVEKHSENENTATAGIDASAWTGT